MAIEGEGHERSILISLPVIPEQGEDSFAFHRNGESGFLCVADGCGGLGARRYERLGHRTGAYLAARIATDCMNRWMAGGEIPFPQSQEEGHALCQRISMCLLNEMKRFEAAHVNQQGSRIVGSMQRTLPTTLCASLFKPAPDGMLDCLFVWAGDSRGYVLDEGGLHQLTADHTIYTSDALASLYNDAPLKSLVNADRPFTVSARRTRAKNPCMLITATDGAFAYFPTPMEFEWLLLSTLKVAVSKDSWQRRLEGKLKKFAADDCTALIAISGYESFEAMKESMEKRSIALQREFITPVRRRKQELGYARQKWEQYRGGYDWTEGKGNGELDWRV